MPSLTLENIHFVPSIHQRMAFADEVRRVAGEINPDCIAVELPPALETWIIRGVLSLPQISVVSYPSAETPGERRFVPIDPNDSMIEALRVAMENEIEVVWLDVEPVRGETFRADLPDDLMIESVGLESYVETVLPSLVKAKLQFAPNPDDDERRERAMARRLAGAARRHQRVLCVLGIAHYDSVRRITSELLQRDSLDDEPESVPIEGVSLAHLNPASIPELFQEIPYVAHLREESRNDLVGFDRERFDKPVAFRDILKQAESSYREEYKSEINLTQFKSLFQFTRNLALATGRLQPDVYEMVMAAKGVIDGDYGYEVYELARSFPLHDEEASIPTVTIHNGRGTFSDREERYRMENVFGEGQTEKVKIRFRRRPPKQFKQIWKEQWEQMDQRGICSWPPEDETQERFMMFIRKRALLVVTEDKKQSLEFTSSLLDGLDIRETMRNWHTEKIYVQQVPEPQGKVGAVVLIFEDEALDQKYSWRCTLYAENENESDISFYATPLGENVVGPRISRTEFAGLLSIFPATQIPDIWRFPGVDELDRCSDALLAAGILFSQDKFVAYVAVSPPSSQMRELAAQYKKYLIYLPIQGFSGNQLKKVRKFHILSGHEVRAYAADYIFDD